MSAFTKVLGLLAVLILQAQISRHVYVRWLAPRTSVLDQFQGAAEKNIRESETLDELVAHYEKALAKAKKDAKEQVPPPAKKEFPGVPVPPPEPPQPALFQVDPDVVKLKSAIELREKQAGEILELHFYWWFGFVSVVWGVAALVWVRRWLGMCGVIAGFVFMMYWTNPGNWFPNSSSWLTAGGVEYGQLLTLKTIYSIAAFALLIGVWLFTSKRRGSTPPAVTISSTTGP